MVMGIDRTKTCGDCIHADICEHIHGLTLFHRKNIAYCLSFKDKADLVEVVRCKDCWKSGEGLCSYQLKNVPGKDFCGDGERRDNG